MVCSSKGCGIHEVYYYISLLAGDNVAVRVVHRIVDIRVERAAIRTIVAIATANQHDRG